MKRLPHWIWVFPFLAAVSAFPAETLFSLPGQANPLDAQNPFARPSVFGPAFTTVSGDATCLFTNPAGLSDLSGPQVDLNTQRWLLQAHQETFLLGFRGPGKSGGFAVAGTYLGFGTFEGRDSLGNPAPSYGAERWGLRGGWGLQLNPKWSIGLGVQGSFAKEADLATNAWGLDLGAQFRPTGRLGLGLACDQLGRASGQGPTSANLQAGLNYDIPLGSHQQLAPALGYSCQSKSSKVLAVVLEYSAGDRVFLRAGYQKSNPNPETGGATGLALGGGLAFGGWRVDYAFLPYGLLGNSHRISLGYVFGKVRVTPGAGPASSTSGASDLKSTNTTGVPGRSVGPGLTGSGPTPAGSAASTAIPAASTVGALGPPPPPSSGIGNGSGAPSEINGTDSGKDEAPSGSNPVPSAATSQAAAKTLMLRFNLAPEYFTQGQVLEKQGKVAEAAQAYINAVKANPKDDAAWRALGGVYYRAGRKNEAILCFERTLSLEPGDANLKTWLDQYKGTNP